ncbi:MAG: histidinol-phosphate transaminase [Candidatus Eremiobacteraeota bacterium]|nr:histidinol-phosphate transaminase [Candidatus Eremiobacteraeota bacterium]
MNERSRAAVRKLEPYKPGTTIDEVKRDLGLERIVKLASNENPLGSSPKALEALGSIGGLNLYLDDSYPELRSKISATYGLRAENVVLGHGSNELIGIVCQTLLEPGDETVMAAPTFSLYKLATQLQGARAVEIPLDASGTHDLDAMLGAVTERTKLVFICDPNNPTGTAIGREAWMRFARALPERVSLLVDQAYREYMGPAGVDAVDVLRERENTIVLRTMSKIYGLASLRFGYGFGHPQLLEWVHRVRLPFNVSRPAAIGAHAALDDDAFVARSVAVNADGLAFVSREFDRLGLARFATEANFYALAVPGGAAQAYGDLLARGIIVRSGDALAMPGYLRISVGTRAENEALVEAIESLLPAWKAREAPAA